jgi:mutator protein MutT
MEEEFLNGDPHRKQILPIVIVYVFNENGEIMLMKRRKHPYTGWWESIGGHIEFGEKVEDAAKRELKEEAGVETGNLNFVSVFDHIEGDAYHRIAMTFATKVDNEVTIDLKDEHDKFKWFSMDNLPKNIIPGPFHEAYQMMFKVSV